MEKAIIEINQKMKCIVIEYSTSTENIPDDIFERIVDDLFKKYPEYSIRWGTQGWVLKARHIAEYLKKIKGSKNRRKTKK